MVDTRTRPGPIGVSERSRAPDLARGAMLLLIALANIPIYLHGRPYGLRQHIVETGLADRFVAVVTTVLIDMRAYPMFAALFAYGLVTIHRRQRAAGVAERQARRVLRRRHLLLIGFGAVHAVLLFSGDILGLYGLLGLLVTRLLRLSDRALLWLAAAWLPIASLLQGAAFADTDTRPDRTMFWSFAIPDYPTAVAFRAMEWLFTPVGLLAVFSAALIGVWAARHDVLTDPHRHRVLLRRTAIVGLTSMVLGGLPIGTAVGGLWTVTDPAVAYLLSALHVATGVCGGMGYAAAIALWATRRPDRPGPVTRALTALGRRSLSGYLAQSVAFAVLLTPPMLGMGRWIGSAQAAGIAVAVWAVTVCAAVLAERRGLRGPAEVLLRRLAYRRTGRVAG
ncbi:putative membrane protein YeiB [Stackebrandtia albiflava]|uniref:Putative membrane protein YeiB n=1 Tax=Stackebrandtia albiflava TaxID=406432 RepID=A0A562V540_9ACTN|nr:DUF418 domain-containing protein [Stackebrandtia albiflava]TWJ12989.1 putative membrane protein YeiB [Stackebrandtia albiflava]